MELEVIEQQIACNELTAAQVFTQMKQYIDIAHKAGWDGAVLAVVDLMETGAGVDEETIKEQLLSA